MGDEKNASGLFPGVVGNIQSKDDITFANLQIPLRS
jgi:hypothetical protein